MLRPRPAQFPKRSQPHRLRRGAGLGCDAMYEFDRDTHVSPQGNGLYHGTASDLWNVGPVPNGGYVLSLAMAALRQELTSPDPLSVTAHYLRPAVPGPFSVAIETVKAGRNYSTAVARLIQSEREVIRVLATYGDLTRGAGPEYLAARSPLPPRAELPPPQTPPGFAPAIAHRFQTVYEPTSLQRLAGELHDRAELAGWLRFADGRPMDVHALGLIADAVAPPVFAVTERGWVPTLELTVHVRARPVGEWLACMFRTRFLFGGLLEEDGEIWDESGQLVALSRQLAGAPRRS